MNQPVIARSSSSSRFFLPEKYQTFNGGFEPPQYMHVFKIAIRLYANIKMARLVESDRPKVLSLLGLVSLSNFAVWEKPSFGLPETLKIVHGNIAYVAQKRNSLAWLASEQNNNHESTNKNKKKCLNYDMRLRTFCCTVTGPITNSWGLTWF